MQFLDACIWALMITWANRHRVRVHDLAYVGADWTIYQPHKPLT